MSQANFTRVFYVQGLILLILSQERKVCIGTQTSVESLSDVIRLTQNWSGPVSLALFLVGEELQIAQFYIQKFLWRCFPKVKNQVGPFSLFGIHLVPGCLLCLG